jgi:beta-N-acetylhexosaminidase
MPHTIIMSLVGPEIKPEESQLIVHPNVAGVILFTRNVTDRIQLRRLTHHIHALNSKVIVMTDHEGGFIQRFLRMGFTPLISGGRHGRNYDKNPKFALEIAHEEGRTMAEELLACGIDLSLAPVLDLHHPDSAIIGQLDRAFHANPDIIIQLTKAYIGGMHDAHMPAVGKHFPGHGSCVIDSHRELPVNNKTEQALRETDLKPFAALMKDNTLDCIMPAHVLYPNVDSLHAATYSRRWLHDILREELKFNGLVMSDCLGMKGADIGNLVTRAEKALLGCDVLIAANQEPAILKQLLEAIPLSSHPDKRFNIFKQKMRRFQPNKIASGESKEFFQAVPHGLEADRFDPLNPTQNV